MKRSFRGSLSLALAAAVAASSLIVASAAHVADTAIASCRVFKNLLVDGFMALANLHQIANCRIAVPFLAKVCR